MHLIHSRSLFKTSMKSALFLAQIPCCSSIPFPAMELHTSCSFALNPILKNNNNPCSSQSQMRYSSNSSSKGHSATDNSYEKPHMYQLEHIQKRLEFTVPLMFKMKLDYTFYRKDVILEDQIFKTTKCGLHNMMNHMATISFFVNITRPYVEAEILNIVPILEDGTVRLRWRIKYLTWLQTLNPANYNKERVKENVKWYDGYSIFYVDGEGLVYKWTLQKTMPDESSLQQMKDKTKEFVRRVVLPVPEQTANFTQINEESDDGIKYFKKRSSLTEERMENNMATNIKLRKMHNY